MCAEKCFVLDYQHLSDLLNAMMLPQSRDCPSAMDALEQLRKCTELPRKRHRVGGLMEGIPAKKKKPKREWTGKENNYTVIA